jgi:hypothetical protein
MLAKVDRAGRRGVFVKCSGPRAPLLLNFPGRKQRAADSVACRARCLPVWRPMLETLLLRSLFFLLVAAALAMPIAMIVGAL